MLTVGMLRAYLPKPWRRQEWLQGMVFRLVPWETEELRMERAWL